MNKKQIARSQTYKQTKLGMTLNRNGPITPIKRPQLPNWLLRGHGSMLFTKDAF